MDRDGGGGADVPAHQRWTVRPRLFWNGGAGRSAFITIGGMREERNGGTLPGRTLPDGSEFPESLETDRLDVGLTAQYPVSDRAFVQLRASGMAQSHSHLFGNRLEEDRHGTLFGEVSLTGTSGRHTWVVGGAVHRDVYRSELFPAVDYAFTVPGLFLQDEIEFSPDLRTSASLRWDAHSEYGSHLSPRASALYRPGPWTARISVGGGFFAPTPFVEEIEAAGLSRMEPLDGLRSERAWTASLDVGRQVRSFELNATLFGSRVEDAVHLVPVDPGASPPGAGGVRLVNVEGETRTAGTELLARYRWEDLTFTGSYVFVRATEPRPTASGPG
jgi:iron complex outermembrane receptor protein